MPIISAAISDRENMRSELVAYLAQKKSESPEFRVIDIGGRNNPWADEVTDAYIDVFEFDTDKKMFVGDINDEDVWQEVLEDGQYDFAIISHVLEDIRYPMTALRWMPRIAKAGILGLPNRHTEFANGVSNYWLGQAHHSWIFTVVKNDAANLLRAVPKFACAEYFNRGRPGTANGEEEYGSRELPWLLPELTGSDNEFVVHWEGDIPFEVPDYFLDTNGQIDMYRTLLANGVEDPK